MKFNIFATILSGCPFFFSLLASPKNFVTHYNGRAAHAHTAQSPAFAANALISGMSVSSRYMAEHELELIQTQMAQKPRTGISKVCSSMK
jgi:hypothetical protein